MATRLYSWARTYPAVSSKPIAILLTEKKERQGIPDIVDELTLQADVDNAAGGIQIGHRDMLDEPDPGTGWILQAGERLVLENIDPTTVYMYSTTASLILNCGAMMR